MDNLERKQYDIIIDGNQVKKVERKTTGRRLAYTNNWRYLMMFGNVGISIVLPLVGGALGGKYIDSALGTYPKVTIGLIALGFIVSLINLIGMFQTVIRQTKLS